MKPTNLQDFRGLATGSFEYHVYYMRPEHFRDGNMGYEFCLEYDRLPNPLNLELTHIKVGVIRAECPEEVFYKMQGENWSPNGEARNFIRQNGLQHTSMSVGDIILEPITRRCLLIDVVGLKSLTPA